MKKRQKEKGEKERSRTLASESGKPERRGSSGGAHRSAGKKALSRKRRRIFFYILIALLVVAAGIVLSFTVLFKIDSISVVGETRYTEEEILAECKIEPGENLFLADTDLARTRLETRLPYLENVNVSRRLPGSIVISASEAVPASVIAAEEDYLLISSQGKVLEHLSDAPKGFPLIKGIGLRQTDPGYSVAYEDEKTARILEELVTMLGKLDFGKIDMIDLSNPLAIEMLYDGRILIQVGIPSDLEYKLKFAKKVLDEKIGAEEKGVLDVSLATDMDAVYFKEGDPNSSRSNSSRPSSQPSSQPSSEIESKPIFVPEPDEESEASREAENSEASSGPEEGEGASPEEAGENTESALPAENSEVASQPSAQEEISEE